MKFNRIITFALLASGIMACSKQELEKPVPQPVEPEVPTVEVKINAGLGEETKSVFSGVSENKMLSGWTTNKETRFFVPDQTAVAATPGKSGRSTTFNVTLPAATSGKLWALSPVGNYNSSNSANCVGGFTQSKISSTYTYTYVVIPTTQTPLANSCDESVHMVAASMDIPSTGVPSEIDLDFQLAIAFGKLTIKNFTSGKIKQAVLTFPNAVAGTSCKFQLESGTITGASESSITLLGDNIVKDDAGNFVLYFGLAESTHNSGDFVVTITDSENKNYTKTVQLNTDKSLTFTTGHIRQIGVDMNGVQANDENPSTESLIYSACMEFPAVSPYLTGSQSYSLTGNETDGASATSTSNKWFRTSTETTDQYIVTHTFQNDGARVRNYSMLYDGSKKCALWVAFALNSTTFGDLDVGRKENWVYDPALPQSIQPYIKNSYTGSYDKGHQAASNDRQTTAEMNRQTFYFSNMTPQYSTLNQGNWETLEQKVQNAGWKCTDRDTMYVVTGPIFESTYSTTTDNNDAACPLPAKYYKCVMKCSFNSSGEVTSASGVAYLTPGNDSSSNTAYTGWKTTIDAVETLTGFDFFTNVPKTIQDAAERTSGLSL